MRKQLCGGAVWRRGWQPGWFSLDRDVCSSSATYACIYFSHRSSPRPKQRVWRCQSYGIARGWLKLLHNCNLAYHGMCRPWVSLFGRYLAVLHFLTGSLAPVHFFSAPSFVTARRYRQSAARRAQGWGHVQRPLGVHRCLHEYELSGSHLYGSGRTDLLEITGSVCAGQCRQILAIATHSPTGSRRPRSGSRR